MYHTHVHAHLLLSPYSWSYPMSACTNCTYPCVSSQISVACSPTSLCHRCPGPCSGHTLCSGPILHTQQTPAHTCAMHASYMHVFQGGFIDLPDKPGFGVTLNREGLVRPYTRTGARHACPSTHTHHSLDNTLIPTEISGDATALYCNNLTMMPANTCMTCSF